MTFGNYILLFSQLGCVIELLVVQLKGVKGKRGAKLEFEQLRLD